MNRATSLILCELESVRLVRLSSCVFLFLNVVRNNYKEGLDKLKLGRHPNSNAGKNKTLLFITPNPRLGFDV